MDEIIDTQIDELVANWQLGLNDDPKHLEYFDADLVQTYQVLFQTIMVLEQKTLQQAEVAFLNNLPFLLLEKRANQFQFSVVFLVIYHLF